MSSHNNPDTSLAANKSFTFEMRLTHFKKITEALKVLGAANYEEIANYLCFKDKVAVGRRLKEMELAGMIFKPGGKSSTTSGRQAYVYQLSGTQPKTDFQIERALKGEGVGDFARKMREIAQKPPISQQELF